MQRASLGASAQSVSEVRPGEELGIEPKSTKPPGTPTSRATGLSTLTLPKPEPGQDYARSVWPTLGGCTAQPEKEAGNRTRRVVYRQASQFARKEKERTH